MVSYNKIGEKLEVKNKITQDRIQTFTKAEIQEIITDLEAKKTKFQNMLNKCDELGITK